MTTKPGRNKTITVKCAYCGNEFQAIESRVKVGQGRFCSRSCAGQDQILGNDRKYVCKHNAKQTFNVSANRWVVYWFDEITGKRYNSTYAKWWWETNRGVIPEGYRASYKDGNSLNISDDNIVLISPEEFGDKMSKLLFGKEFSLETREKMSIAKKGSHLSQSHKDHIGEATKKMWQEGIFDTPEIRQAYSNQGKSTKGNKWTEEQKKKITGKITSEATKIKLSNSLKGRERSEEHRKHMSISGKKRKDIRGKNSKWWRGGLTNVPYPDEFSPCLRKIIRSRDNHVCQVCGMDVYRSIHGHVHHIDGDKTNSKEDNLILLCSSCHRVIHGRNNVPSEKIIELRNKLKSI